VALRRGLPAYEQSLAHLMLGRMKDIASHREEALAEYRQVDQGLWKPLTHAAVSGLDKPYELHALRKLVVDYERNDLFRF
jgi:hypothetical protein